MPTPLTLYAATKMATERCGPLLRASLAPPITMFRFFTVYGPWGRPDMAFFKFTDAILRGRPIDIYDHGRMERDFTYVDDLVEAITRLIPCVPAAGQAVGPGDLNQPGGALPGGEHRQCPAGAIAGIIAEIERATGRAAIRNMMDMQPGEVLKTWADSSLLQALTGYRPTTDVATGVAAFVAWFRSHYGL